ncbi:MAG: sulfotransferase domain-containing protein, partial [Aldersonia sp.]|nr:sulfotransferase domain-containing protein [Aldersonia sp.]
MPDHAPMLPNLLIAGVTKAGTTSLFAYLAQHPQICAASSKDINYFSPLRRGEPVTQPLSVHDQYFSHCDGRIYRLDASPDYFNGDKPVVDAVHDQYPGVKIIMILRDPVRRLWSSFKYRKSLGRLDSATTFDEFFDDCLESYHLERYGTADYEHHRTLPLARYAEHLALWFDAFGDDV